MPLGAAEEYRRELRRAVDGYLLSDAASSEANGTIPGTNVTLPPVSDMVS